VIPDEAGCLALHAKYGSGVRVIEHCRVVTGVSMSLTAVALSKIGGLKVDGRAIFAGALLHDIGRSRVQTVEHGYVGAKILEEEGLDPIVVEIVRRHVGAGISSEEAGKLGFPAGDYVPLTLEQRVVCFADKMVSADGVRPLSEEVKGFERKGHDVSRLLALKRSLQEDLGEDPERIALGTRTTTRAI
jgi:uncharacterized protein (TIGR00295 family)